MKRSLLSLLIVMLVSGCRLFEIPRTDPDLQREPWAEDAIRKAKAGDEEKMQSELRQQKAEGSRR